MRLKMEHLHAQLHSRRAVFILSTVTLLGSHAAAQSAGGQLAALELEATYAEPFSYLNSARELSDGSLVVADPISQVVLRLNLTAGTADTLGRQGPGPQEYDAPDRVLALPGDSTLLVDLGNGRLVVIDPSGKFVEWTPLMTSSSPGVGGAYNPSFVDAAGNLYDIRPVASFGPSDTNAMHRIDRTTGSSTRVAFGWYRKITPRRRGVKRPAYDLYDDFAVGSDGRVAVVRANGYSVDWYLPDGRIVRGPENEVERYPVSEADKAARVESWATNSVMFYADFEGDGSATNMSQRRGVPARLVPGIDGFDWPETLPVFQPEQSLVSPQNELWVHRIMPVDGPGRVEVFDERGIRKGFVELPSRSRVIGFGDYEAPHERVYVARTDDVGLVWLEQYVVARNEG